MQRIYEDEVVIIDKCRRTKLAVLRELGVESCALVPKGGIGPQ